MAKIEQKLHTFTQALSTLQSSIALFNEYSAIFKAHHTEKNEELFTAMRDSMIQRFEYCTDLFWKVLKIYLEDVEKITLPTYSPRSVVRESVHAKIISEQEGERCMVMIENRNRTSHIYHEETADDIAQQVPNFYQLMQRIIERVQGKINTQ